MNLEDVCKRSLVTIDAAASVTEAALLMGEQHVGALAVVSQDDPHEVCGVVTDRDIALDVVGRDRSAAILRVADIARRPPAAIPATAGILEAAQAMQAAGTRRLLVVDEWGATVGMVSCDDLIAAIAHELGGVSGALGETIARERAAPGRPRAAAAAPASHMNFGAPLAEPGRGGARP